MGSKGQLDRLPVAHSGPILALDWCTPDGGVTSSGGWVASGSLDRTVKVWDLTGPHFERTPAYTLTTQFPIRRVRWRPGYECEIAVASNAEIGAACAVSDLSDPGVAEDVDLEKPEVAIPKRRADMGYAVEIWDVRRGYIAKWLVGGSAIEGGVTGTSTSSPCGKSSGSCSQISTSEIRTLSGRSIHLERLLSWISGILIVLWTRSLVLRLRGLSHILLRL